MAFANLFTRLSAVEEDVKSPAQPAFTRRNEGGKRGNAGKRKNQGGQAGPHKKKQCYQAQSRAEDKEHARVGFKQEQEGHSDKDAHGNSNHQSENRQTKKNKWQQQKKKEGGQKNQHQQKNGGRPAHRSGRRDTRGGGNRKNYKQDIQVKRTRVMTQEFRDQNVLAVDGRLLCRHFLWGRCIKGDECQMEHIQGYNDLVKEVCKFYVQGHCTKGESCPYMHKSFPCKFFHKKHKCLQGADCKFSHEPLTELTEQLLDQALKRESDLYELSKKAEQESSGQPANTEEAAEANGIPDIFLQPLRPNFYKSTDTNAEEDASLRSTEEQVGNTDEAAPPHASEAARPHGPQSDNLSQEEPVCYSVEAVLGPQLSKPFSGFYTAPRSQVSSSDCTSDSANSRVPYSVDAVLSSYKSAESSTFSHTSNPPGALTVSYTPKKTHDEEITDPLAIPEKPNEKASHSAANKSQDEMFSSSVSKTCPSLTPASGNHKKQRGSQPQSLKPAQRASHEDKLELLRLRGDVNSASEGVFPVETKQRLFSQPAGQKPTSQQPTQSVLTTDSQASVKASCPPSGFTEFKGRAAVSADAADIKSSDSANSAGHRFAEKQPAESRPHPKKTQSCPTLGTKQRNPTETTAECGSERLRCGDLAAECKKTMKRPFDGLFANPIADILQPKDELVAGSSCPQDPARSSCPAAQSADRGAHHLKAALARRRDSAHSFLSLFAAPLSAASVPCTQSRTCSLVSDSLGEASTSAAVSPRVVRSPTIQAHRQLPDCSSHTGSAANSVLKTLFLRLSPYQQDGEQQGSGQISASSESGKKDQSSTGCVTVSQQEKCKEKGRRRKKVETQGSTERSTERSTEQSTEWSTERSTERAVAHSTEHLSTPQTPLSEPQVRDSAALNLPFKPAAQETRQQTRPKLKHAPEGAKRVNVKVAATPLKDLFRSLDAAVFQSGR